MARPSCSDLVAALEAANVPLTTRRGRVVIVDDVPARRSVTRKETRTDG